MVSEVTFFSLWHRETVLVTAAAGATGLAVTDVATKILQARVCMSESPLKKITPPNMVFKHGLNPFIY